MSAFNKFNINTQNIKKNFWDLKKNIGFKIQEYGLNYSSHC